MKVSESWLREWVNPAVTTDELVAQLTMAGLEVEEEETVAPHFDKVVIAHVLEVARHPGADRPLPEPPPHARRAGCAPPHA